MAMEVKAANELGFEGRKSADFFKKIGEQANVPGHDINNKLISRVQRASSSLRPSQLGEQYSVTGTNVNVKA